MVYLPDALHKNLKRLAVERETSVAQLIREAALALMEEDKEDVESGLRALKEFRKDPASAVALEDYHHKRMRR